MKLDDLFYKIASFFKVKKHDEEEYKVKNANIRIVDVPYAIFLVIKKYGWVVFFHKLINYIKLFYKNSGNFYRAAKFSLKREGFRVMITRSFNFMIYGKGVLDKKLIVLNSVVNISGGDCSNWITKYKKKDLDKFKKEINKFKYAPKISIITPVYNVHPKWLNECVGSVLNQIYGNWELCLYDDASTNMETVDCLKKWEKKDSRIKIYFGKKNLGIAGASNEALKITKGDFIALLDNDDEIKEDALFWVIKEINNHPDADLIYTDECKKTSDDKFVGPIFKPDWSPEYLLNDMYTGHLSVYRKSIMEKIGAFRSEYDFSQDYDLVLRVSEVTEKIYHIEKILYFWRQIEGSAASGDKNFARKSNLAALGDAMKRREIEAKIIEYPWANRAKILFAHDSKISIIIPSDSYSNIIKSIKLISEKTSYQNFEIIIVTNSKLIEKLKTIYSSGIKNLIFSSYDKKYNFSDKCNQGANDSNGEILIFLNDDVFPIATDWIENLVEFLFYDKKIGSVSPKLLYENDVIQYAGMTTNVNPFCGTFLNGRNKNELLAKKVRNTSILSGACFAIRKKVFFEVGMFDSINTPAGHSDLDLSFKLRENGYRCLYTPYATLYHVGNHSWHTKKDKADIFVLSKWGKYISNDPYYTRSMRAMIEGYSPEQFNIYSHQNKFKKYKFDALIVLHELTVTGAPIVALNTAKAIIEEGGYPVVYSYSDGPLRNEFEKIDVPVIVNHLAKNDEFSFRNFAKNFDIVIANTIIVYPAVNMIQDIVPTIWYLHEAKNIEDYFIPNFRKSKFSLVKTLKKSPAKIYAASEYSRNAILKYRDEVKLLKLGFIDQSINEKINLERKITFSIVGTVEKRKAQDVFIDAVLKMPKEYRKKSIFNIVGNDKAFINYASKLKHRTKDVPEIIWHGLIIDQVKKMKLFLETSVFVIVSRDEPTSIVVIEGAMLGRPSIISENVGAKYLIEKDKTGFIVETGNAGKLMEVMMKIIDNPNMLIPMGENARKKYLETSTFDIFQKNLIKAIKETMDNGNDK